MATTLITGRGLTLTIGGKTYAEQTASVTLSISNNQQELETLAGRVYKSIDYTGTMTVELLADTSVTAGLFNQLWDATKSAPDTSLAFTFVSNTGGSAGTITTIAGKVFPSFPDLGGGATDVLKASVSLKLDASSALTRTQS